MKVRLSSIKRVEVAVKMTKAERKSGSCRRKRRAGDQKPIPATKMRAIIIDASPPMVRQVLIMALAPSPELGRNLISA